MQFANLEELIRHVVTGNIDIAGVDFAFPEQAVDGPVEAVAVDVESTAPDMDPAVVPAEDELVDGLTLHLASGEVKMMEQADGSILVDSFQMTPNACGVGSIVIDGRTITVNMCQMDESTVAYLPTSKNGVHTYNNPVKIALKKRT